MVDTWEPNRDGGDGSTSCFQKTVEVTLRDWWLVKSQEEIEGKRVGVAGTELMASIEQRAVRVFTSAPIVKAFDVYTLETADGICIYLKGFIHKERTVKNGFSPEIFRHFIFGFPPCWEEIVKKCFEGGASCYASIDSVSPRIETDLAHRPVLTPCKKKEENLEDEHVMKPKGLTTDNPISLRSENDHQPKSLLSPSQSEDINNIDKTNDKDGSIEDSGLPEVDMAAPRENPGSKGRKTRTHSTKQLVSSDRIEIKQIAVRKSLRLQSKDVGKSTESEEKSSSTKLMNCTYDGDHCNSSLTAATGKNCESWNEAKGDDAEKRDDKDGIEDDLVSPEVDTIRPGQPPEVLMVPASKDRTTRKYTTRESVRSERLKVKDDEIRASPFLLSKDSEKNTETGPKGNSNKLAKSAKGNDHPDPSYHSGTIFEEDESCVQREYLTAEKTKRRINFDLEVTPRKQVRTETMAVVSSESLSFSRSRSGRLLVPTLEFWRNQVPLYDARRKIIGIKEGIDAKTPARGSGSESQRRRR